MACNLHSDLPRGSDNGGSLEASQSGFVATDKVLGAQSLRFVLPNAQGKIFLGALGAEVGEERLPDGRLDRYAMGGDLIGVPDDRHLMTIAGSRSGKGRCAIIPNLVTYPGSVLAVDPKGDLAAETAEWRAVILEQKVIVLDPFKVTGRASASYGGGFNPMSILNEEGETLVEDAGLIADALVVPSPGTTDPHWDESAKQFLEGVILHVATHDAYAGRRHLVSVYYCIMEEMERLEDEMKENTAANAAALSAANSFFQKGDNERSSVLSSLRRHIRFLGYGPMQDVVQEHSFDLRELKQRKMTLYLSLPAMRMGTCSRWLRLFVNLSLAALETEKVKPVHPVLMCLDEFAVLGQMKTLEDAAGQIAGLGCKLWPILQDLNQLEYLYEKRWETFLGNAGLIQCFGNADLKTLKWISERLGKTSVVKYQRSNPSISQRAKEGITGASFNQDSHELMTPEEVSRFFGRDDPLLRQLIIRPTWSPMILQRVYHDKHGLFDAFRNFKKSISDEGSQRD